MLVDDNYDLLELLKVLITPSCDIVGLVTDGFSVLDSVTSLKPDVVVLDISMPKVNGFDICRGIKGTSPETKVIFLTAFDHEEMRKLALSLGADALIGKSSANELLNALHCIGQAND
jgi:CheY-like chemotaxis protein